MEIVDFSNSLFHDIPQQDNPAYGSEECIMITKDSQRQALFAVLHIEPVTDPFEDESVTKICECYKLENAKKIASFFANGGLTFQHMVAFQCTMCIVRKSPFGTITNAMCWNVQTDAEGIRLNE